MFNSASNKTVRRPEHLGTRLVGPTGTQGGAALIAAPLLPGERINSMRLDAIALAKDEDSNFDQPPLLSWFGVIVPFPFAGSEEFGVSDLDDIINKLDESESGNVHVGGEEALSGTNEEDYTGSMGLEQPYMFLFRRRIGRPVAVGKDSLDNTDARFYDEFHTRWRRRIYIPTSAILLIGAKNYDMSANTTFGISQFDASTTPNNLLDAYSESAGGGNAANLSEVLFGGDNYIEADSFKDDDVRYYAHLQLSISKNTRLGDG